MSTELSKIRTINYALEFATNIYLDSNNADRFYSDKETDLQCGIYIDDILGRVIVSFRGTTSVEDKLIDLDLVKTKYSGKITVHSGFYKQLFLSKVYVNFYQDLINILKQKQYEVFITGHSLGAALATLFSFKLSHVIDDKINLITFASPKVGNYHWMKAFSERSNISNTRVVVTSDPIPLTPIFTYYHVSNPYYLRSGRFFWYIEDHSTTKYKKLLLLKKDKIERRLYS